MAIKGTDVDASLATLVRTYEVQDVAALNCPIWQAIRATTADRHFLKDICIGPEATAVPYVGAEFGDNNPTRLVLDEANKLYKGQKLQLIISIGAGYPGTIALPDQSGRDVQAAFCKIAADCTREADLMKAKFEEEEADTGHNPYWRFSVEQGMQNMSAKDCDLAGKIQAHTWAYLKVSKVSGSLDKMLKRAASPALEEKIKKAIEKAEMMMHLR